MPDSSSLLEREPSNSAESATGLIPAPGSPEGGNPLRPAKAAAKSSRIYVLDGLRLAAALAVLYFHYLGGSGNSLWGDSASRLHRLHRVAEYGWLGVMVFYMISGFVICMSSWGRSLQDFWKGRILRLFPLYWFAVVLSTVFLRYTPHQPGEPHITLTQMLTNLTMLQEPLGTASVDVVYWTLWIELRFYIIFSLVVWMGTNYRRVASFCWIWAITSVLAPSAGIPLLELLTVPLWAPFFIAGTAFYLVRQQGRLNGELIGLLALSWLLMQRRMNDIVTNHGTVGISVVVMTMMYVLMLLIALGKLDRIQWRWLPIAGALSYPLYLVHQCIGVRLIQMFHAKVGAFSLLAALTVGMLVAAWLVHRFVERPATRLVRRLMQAGVATEPAAVAPQAR
ncbi:acyltransferase [Kitasatospora sp. NPDC049258]|uniref:acyltransferase family protein n=1 Tax=Kitasatospora sp. NPDC049258 TaxID=3155394 RepID=UPI00343AC0C6